MLKRSILFLSVVGLVILFSNESMAQRRRGAGPGPGIVPNTSTCEVRLNFNFIGFTRPGSYQQKPLTLEVASNITEEECVKLASKYKASNYFKYCEEKRQIVGQNPILLVEYIYSSSTTKKTGTSSRATCPK